MEGLTNPFHSDVNSFSYCIFKNEPFISVDGVWFIKHEPNKFGIESYIKKLQEIIHNVLNALEKVSYENKDTMINTIKEKDKLLENLLDKYKSIKQKYLENDKYFRKELFAHYSIKYEETPIFYFSESRKYLDIMNEIQSILYSKFKEFYGEFLDIIDSFFTINNYIIKIKKFFNFQF